MNKLKLMRFLRLLYIVVIGGSLAATYFAGATVTTTATSAICSVVAVVRTFIAFIALLLFIIGGVLYAIAHFLPAAGNLRGNLQGWSIGMLIGGIVGIILVLVAPGLINLIVGAGGNTSITSISGGC